jgi:hypothetical protein
VVASVEQRQGQRERRGEPGTAAARGGGDGCGAGMRGRIAEAGGGGGARLADGKGAVPRGWQRGRFREARGGSRGTGLERTGAWVKAVGEGAGVEPKFFPSFILFRSRDRD